MAHALGRLAGRGLGQIFRAVKTVRPQRPIHPDGVSLTGRLERLPRQAADSGITVAEAGDLPRTDLAANAPAPRPIAMAEGQQNTTSSPSRSGNFKRWAADRQMMLRMSAEPSVRLKYRWPDE